MIFIACVDDNFGMMFNKRRQSQDSVLREWIINRLNGEKLWMNEYSAGQFGDFGESIISKGDFLNECPAGGFALLENDDPSQVASRIEGIWLCHWNRSYPGDVKFDKGLLAGFSLKNTTEIVGSSHEKITIEEWGK